VTTFEVGPTAIKDTCITGNAFNKECHYLLTSMEWHFECKCRTLFTKYETS